MFLPGESRERRSLVGYSPWGSKELDTTEWLHFHFFLKIKDIIEDTNEHPDEEVYRVRSGGVLYTGASLCMEFEICLSWHVHSFINWEVLWTHLLRVFKEASLHRPDWLNHWPVVINSISSPSLLPGIPEDGTENPNPQILSWFGFSGNQLPSRHHLGPPKRHFVGVCYLVAKSCTTLSDPHGL